MLHGVLVTFRRPQCLETMLVRLSAQDRQVDSLVVVDNDPEESARTAVERYAESRPGVHYLPTGANLGPAGGIARGMEHVLRDAADDDWVVLFDDDDPPDTAQMLSALVEMGARLRQRDQHVAAVGLAGARFDAARGLTIRPDDEALVGAVPSDYIGGNQLPCYSVHAIRAVGFFDETLFFGFEELEYGLRLRAAGFGLYAHGGLWRSARDRHGRLGMDARPRRGLDAPTWRRYYSVRNLIYILRHHGNGIAALRLAARSLGKPIYNLPSAPALATKHLRLNARAVADAYFGRMGRTIEPVRKG